MDDDEGKERQAIWGIRKKHEIWFYTFLLIFGGWNIARLDWKDWDSFVCAAGERILASVLIVWFAYQAFDWGLSGLMSAGDFFRQQIARRKEEDRKRKEAQEQARQKQIEQMREEAEAFQKRFNEELLKQGVTKEQIQKAQQLSGSIPPSPPPPSSRRSGGGGAAPFF